MDREVYKDLVLRKDYTDGLDYDIIRGLDGVVLAYYYPSGYEYISCFLIGSNSSILSFKSRFALAFMTAINVTWLNTGVSEDKIFNYVDLLCSERFDTRGFTVNRDKIKQAIKLTGEGKAVPHYRVGKFKWARKLSAEQKRSIIFEKRIETTIVKNVNLIESAIESLCETDYFITYKEIAKEINRYNANNGINDEVSVRTIERYVNDALKERINEHNIYVHGTSAYKEYEKQENVASIVGAIDAVIEVGNVLSKKMVSTYASVHRNTVTNLWNEPEIQEAIERYNTVKQ